MGPRVRSGSPGRARVEWMWRVCPRLPGGPGLDHDGQLRIGGVSLLQSGSLLVIRDTGASLTRAGADAIRMNELDAGGLSGRVVFPPGEGIGRTRPGAGSRPRRGRSRPPDRHRHQQLLSVILASPRRALEPFLTPWDLPGWVPPGVP